MDKIFQLIEKEEKRQNNFIQLIASENFVSKDVLQVTGSILTNKYAEGYPGKRYYAGTKYIDKIEEITIERAKKLFNVKYVNVQPHSGSQANAAVYNALLKPGDSILGLSLDAGGHLSHGSKVNFSGQIYNSYTYGVNESGILDFKEIRKIALEINPKIIICGYSSYPRKVEFDKFAEIAQECKAYLMADIAHIAGLVATGHHMSPIGYADVITTTTHKTLRGARGGLIMTNNEEMAIKINKSIFPGIQGGPLMHQIAGKGQAFYEALKPSFSDYINQVVVNSKSFANKFIELGAKVITNGTDNHLFIIDVKTSYGITGKEAQDILEENGIIVNKNVIPSDDESPSTTSGIRIGTPAMTSRKFNSIDFESLAILMDSVLRKEVDKIIDEVKKMAFQKPILNKY